MSTEPDLSRMRADQRPAADPDEPALTLADIVEASTAHVDADRPTARLGVVAALAMVACAVLLGTIAGLVLYPVLLRVLAFLG